MCQIPRSLYQDHQHPLPVLIKVSVRQPHPLMYVYVVHLSFISVIFMVFILHIYFGFIVVEGDSADI